MDISLMAFLSPPSFPRWEEKSRHIHRLSVNILKTWAFLQAENII